MAYYIGIMSGTSLDGIDSVLIKSGSCFEKVLAHHFAPFPKPVLDILQKLHTDPQCSFSLLGEIDNRLSYCYVESVKSLLKKSSLKAHQIDAIGCHGQTVFHQPKGTFRFSIQLGNPNILAYETGITVVMDFRGMDIAGHGDGAPLAPKLHAALFTQPEHTCAVINLGGIANTTILAPNKDVIGFDNGPANCLMDNWIQHHYPNMFYDHNGTWAKTGTTNTALLQAMLTDPYFHRSPPKSTGKEMFNMQWLHSFLSINSSLSPQDVQATLCQLTATVLANDVKKMTMPPCTIYLCGGGANNIYLVSQLNKLLPQYNILLTTEIGIPVNQVEAIAFAWLAQCRLEHQYGNIPSVTGAKEEVLLGGIYRSHR